MLTTDTQTAALSLSLLPRPLLSQSCSRALLVAWTGPGALITLNSSHIVFEMR